MDYDRRKEVIQDMRENAWVERISTARVDGRMCSWITTLHPNQLHCQLDGGLFRGSYNLCQKFVFSDNTTWLLRFPRIGAICEDYANEKVAIEVEVLSLIYERTAIPVPKVFSWGLAIDNPLDLGAFILMEFIEGTNVSRLLKDPNPNSRLVREDFGDDKIELLFRQICNFQLQIFELNFDRIGSLPTSKTGFSVPIRPLTWKVHDIIQTGGVNTFGDRTRGFSTTTEYFEYIINQDCEQLDRQPNSVTGQHDAKATYIAFEILKSLVPGYVNKQYDRGPFKLVCDDLGLSNLIVKSDNDLTVVGVIDLEWSYIGPAQLFASAPWWLLQDRPIYQEWDCETDQLPIAAVRYFKYLKLYKRVLEEEETKRPGHEKKEFSNLVKWSETSGAMWMHMMLSCGFNDTYSFPFTQFKKRVGIDKWIRYRSAIDSEKREAFVAQKLLQLKQYDKDLAEIQVDKERVDRGEMTRADFLATHGRALLTATQ